MNLEFPHLEPKHIPSHGMSQQQHLELYNRVDSGDIKVLETSQLPKATTLGTWGVSIHWYLQMFSWKSGNHVFVFPPKKTARLLSQAKLLQRSSDVVPHKSPSPPVFEGPVLKLFQDVPRHQVPHRQWKVMRTFPEPKHSSWHSPSCWWSNNM